MIKKMNIYFMGLVIVGYACSSIVKAEEQTEVLLPEKPIVIVITSYNNSQWYKKNIDSVVTQRYTNFKVIYVDDCSPDGTGQLVADYIKERHLENRVTLIRNPVRRGALANIYTAVHMCDDQSIVATVDGDDWLKHDAVLTRINKEYVQNGAWMTYGHYEVYPSGTSEPHRATKKAIIVHNAHREWDWVTSQLRTFYAWLFKRIKLQDFIYEGNFFDVAWDLSLMFPMLEMSAERALPIPDILYVYNCANPLNDFKVKLIRQIHCDKRVRSMPKYTRLKEVPASVGIPSSATAQAVILSHNSPASAVRCLASLAKYAKVQKSLQITIFYQATTTAIAALYAQAQKELSEVAWVAIPSGQLRPVLLAHLQAHKTAYVVLAHDHMQLSDAVDLDAGMRILEKTYAHGIYYALAQKTVPHASLVREQRCPRAAWIEDDLFAWQFKDGEQEWRAPFTCSMALYTTADLCAVMQEVQFVDSNSFERACARMRFDVDSVGLFYKTAKAITNNE